MTTFKLKRKESSKKSTISTLTLKSKVLCKGLEDGYRKVKVKGKTRIPAGRYRLKLRKEGGFHNRYSKRFPRMHKGMIQITGVDNYKYILVHIGNSHRDTEGCLLVGLKTIPRDKSPTGEFYLQSSTVAYKKVYPILLRAILAGDTYLEITDNKQEC